MDVLEWRTRYWDDSEVSQLLALWGDERVQRELDGTRRDNQVFIKLSEDLRRRGILRSPAQVREKIKILKREYRLCLGRLNQTQMDRPTGCGTAPTKFKYFEQMCVILGTPSGYTGPLSQRHFIGNRNILSGGQTTVPSSSSIELPEYLIVPNNGSYLIPATNANCETDTKPLDLHMDYSTERKMSDCRKNAKNELDSRNDDRLSEISTSGSSSDFRSEQNRPSRPNSDVELDPKHFYTKTESSEIRMVENNRPVINRGLKRKRNDRHDIADSMLNFFKDSTERFFKLEEARMQHEREMESARRIREERLWDKLGEIASQLVLAGGTRSTMPCCGGCCGSQKDSRTIRPNNDIGDSVVKEESVKDSRVHENECI